MRIRPSADVLVSNTKQNLEEAAMNLATTVAQPLPDLAENLPRRVHSTIRPRSVADVRKAVIEAGETGVALYPISRGLNWGLGSRKPVDHDCAILDLSGMDRIRHIDLDRGYAVIEAGVTQGELSDQLKETRFFLNVTTSARESSVIGNALDRGQGMMRLRAHDLIGLEAVLGDGKVLTTGVFGNAGGRSASGVVAGPDLTKIFCHSNFGVVTAATISLIRRPERTVYVYGAFEGAAMPAVVEAIYRMRHDGVFRSIFYLGEMQIDQGDGPRPRFTVLGPLVGRDTIVEAAERIVLEELHKIPGCTSLRSGPVDELDPSDPVYLRARMFVGEPTSDMIKQRFGTTTTALDENSIKGWSVIQTLLPHDSGSVDEAMAIVARAVDEFGISAHPHLSTVSSRSINLMTMIWFDRSPEGSECMRTMRDKLHRELRERGFLPSREGIDALHEGASDRPGEASALLKRALDPQGIISPGRYV